ncbi:MAG: hypothetical protein ACK58L_08945 [Planctomycetota bacterium]
MATTVLGNRSHNQNPHTNGFTAVMEAYLVTIHRYTREGMKETLSQAVVR